MTQRCAQQRDSEATRGDQRMARRGEVRGAVVPHLSAWRRSQALTQGELAIKAKVARSTVIRAEGGEPISLPNVRKVAEALGISVQQLLREEPDSDDDTEESSGAA